MVTKESIMKSVDRELTLLIEEYERQLHRKDIEIKELKNQLLKRNAENVELQLVVRQQAKEIELKKNQAFSYLSTLEEGNLEEVRKILELNDSEEVAALASAMEQMWRKRENGMLAKLFEEVNSPHYRKQLKNSEFNYRLLAIIQEILSATDSIDYDSDALIEKAMEYAIQSIGTNGEQSLREYLKAQHQNVYPALLQRNESHLIRTYFRLLLTFTMKQVLQESLKHMVTVEWSFLVSSMSKEDFEFYFWYSYLFDGEQRILDRAKEFYPQGMQNVKGFRLFYQAAKSTDVTEEAYREARNTFRSNKNLTNMEQELVLEKVDQRIKPRLQSSVKAHEAPIYIITSTEYDKLKQTLGLQRKRMKLPLYQKDKLNQIYLYKEVSVWFSKVRGRAFLVNKEYREFSKQIAPLVIKTGEMRYTLPPEGKAGIQSSSFVWPSTEVKKKKENPKNEEKTLNETSELKRLGYQITGVNRAKRWQALELAVPKIGLKKVVGIISYNILLRKGQKNGERKFAYAIAEWEHDLEKLKKHYYRNDFKWPNTKK